MAENETVGVVWEKQPGESPLWYNRFFRFYLMVPISRSVRNAWILNEIEKYGDPGKAQEHARRPTPKEWDAASHKYSWRERAAAYDKDQQRQALETVAAIRLQLQQATPQALQALLDALTNGRTKVAAAEAIFNRAGLPPTTKSEIKADVGVQLPSAAEVARALDELEKEEKEDNDADQKET